MRLVAVFVRPLSLVAVRLIFEAVDIPAADSPAVDTPAVDILAVQSVVASNQHSQSVVLLLLLHRVAVHSCCRTCFQQERSPHIVYKMSRFHPHSIVLMLFTSSPSASLTTIPRYRQSSLEYFRRAARKR